MFLLSLKNQQINWLSLVCNINPCDPKDNVELGYTVLAKYCVTTSAVEDCQPVKIMWIYTRVCIMTRKRKEFWSVTENTGLYRYA